MAVTVEKYIDKVTEIYKLQPKYKLGHDGSDGYCDCIGMVRGALKRAGGNTSGLSGTNYAARYTIKDLKKIGSANDLKLGEVVMKAKNPSDSGYNLPDKYRVGGSQYNGDLQDYTHIGTVTQVNPLRITHMTSPSAKIDTKIGNWKYHGKLPQVAYNNTPGEVVIVIEYATVVGGSLNLRSEPSKSAAILTTIPNKSKVAIVEHTNKEWDKVVYNSYTGYAMSMYLSTDGDNSGKVTISLSKENANELYEALKSALNK